MEGLIKLNEFLTRAVDNPRLSPVHISLYAGLLKCWQDQHFSEPFYIFSRHVMPICKISGPATYHRSIKELREYGYIEYLASYNQFLGSMVRIIPLSAKQETLLSKLYFNRS